ncbi:P-loop NTPase fold protein [Neorhizobium sp. BT27B]|uniref:KAP family P-loop NTPase fold protein n=1 Tax=Neorhizobium sp. BT27B TaxID=3142625 RepID=UPI003D2CBE39
MDNAIRNGASDRLGRRFFAESLARQVWSINDLPEGYVVGIEAEWGAGKSSVINMTLQHLLHLELSSNSAEPAFHGDEGKTETPETLSELSARYDAISTMAERKQTIPYLHPDHHHRAIAAQADGDEELRKRLYRYFRLRLNAAVAPRNVVVHFRPWLVPDTAALSSVFLDELSKSVGGALGTDVEGAMREYAKVMQRLAPVAGIAAQAALPGSGNAVRDFFASYGRQEASMETRKLRLEAALRELDGRKIILVIDDLDRLSPREATEMVGLVKSLGNLPNILYLISYDRNVLCGHLRRTLRVDAEAYLEKIVQYRRALPMLSPERVLVLLDECRRELFDGATDEVLDRAQEASVQVLRQYVVTPRDAVRCADWVLRAHRLLKDQTDPVDLLILETLNAKDT